MQDKRSFIVTLVLDRNLPELKSHIESRMWTLMGAVVGVGVAPCGFHQPVEFAYPHLVPKEPNRSPEAKLARAIRSASQPVSASSPERDSVVEEVRQKLLERSQFGIKKYGTMLNRTDVDLRGWLVHIQEELMDAANYAQAAINKIDMKADV